jgi:hypothetical protein
VLLLVLPNDWALLLIGTGEGLHKVTADILLYKLREREKSRGEILPDVQLCINGVIGIVVERG